MVVVFEEDMEKRYEANEPIPSRPYPVMVMSVKKYQERTNR